MKLCKSIMNRLNSYTRSILIFDYLHKYEIEYPLHFYDYNSFDYYFKCNKSNILAHILLMEHINGLKSNWKQYSNDKFLIFFDSKRVFTNNLDHYLLFDLIDQTRENAYYIRFFTRKRCNFVFKDWSKIFEMYCNININYSTIENFTNLYRFKLIL
uniref:Uncharacterized protein n=1 Tax=Compsopogon caeruleus TaxID=31354 RepID=A0A1Z1XBH9_9RHOD|nr:hypothetical protein [Compsopogon caeruleus]ARX96190.1 hypothetical protein [Compsopogon caeruleus]